MLIRTYSDEEKRAYIEEFKASGMSQSAFSNEKGIAKTTFRDWLKMDKQMAFGEIDLNQTGNLTEKKPKYKKTMVFAKEDIKIELKEGFDKQFLRDIVEVLINVY